jgi:hypothetical protein
MVQSEHQSRNQFKGDSKPANYKPNVYILPSYWVPQGILWLPTKFAELSDKAIEKNRWKRFGYDDKLPPAYSVVFQRAFKKAKYHNQPESVHTLGH